MDSSGGLTAYNDFAMCVVLLPDAVPGLSPHDLVATSECSGGPGPCLSGTLRLLELRSVHQRELRAHEFASVRASDGSRAATNHARQRPSMSSTLTSAAGAAPRVAPAAQAGSSTPPARCLTAWSCATGIS